MRTVTAAVALAIALGSSTAAVAQTQPPPTSVGTSVSTSREAKGPSVWGILPWAGIGVGARFMFPLGIKPLITNSSVHDSFAIEGGADYLHWSYGLAGFNDYSWNAIVPVVGIMWNIWINENFAAYPKVELGWAFGWVSLPNGYSGTYSSHSGIYPDFAAGVLYRLNNGITLRGEIGYAGLKLGAGWLF